jgi:2-polyprenyl-6-hydroxyphenyl methylase / 3-demethylubiquinone-9 3-methyltransferase
MKSTIKSSEINQFQKDSANWWKESGPFAPLHALNPVRLRFIHDVITDHFKIKSKTPNNPLKNIRIIDVGCGGGLMCEPLSRIGAHVTGLDADPQAIKVARDHAKAEKLTIIYEAEPLEIFREKNKGVSFDAVLALEIIEHVADVGLFLDEVTAAVKPDGLLILSTLNRTAKSYALGIVAAEYILGWVPKGTHNWQQFIKPAELARHMTARGFEPFAANGLNFNPITREFRLDPHDLSVNYLMAFRRAGKI